ncbi:hypothetical protein AURDEDRAFT_177894 [Auricularia subglabra TFB-10046 SS5]|uniref:Uncharacterized protein n=1 Tax=Auricularia subglabra (strain TFB-10046 / SS5) TaxID=717982 RepID=J0WMH8_AURST|nr:hypothetical protein AURDEDRAFT_177894 [Auricularia subglabra TFB-10046 SS5]
MSSAVTRRMSARRDRPLARSTQHLSLSLSQQLDRADAADPSTHSPCLETPRRSRHASPSFNFVPTRYSSASSGDDEEESFRRMFTRQRVYTPSSSRSRSQCTIRTRASSPDPVSPTTSHSPSTVALGTRALAKLPSRTGLFRTRTVDVSMEQITSKPLEFNVAISHARLTWGNIQSNVAHLFSDGEFGLEVFDELVGKWRQFGLDGSVNVLGSQLLVRGRVIHAHAHSLDGIELFTSELDTSSPDRSNINGKRPTFAPLKMAPRTDKKAKLA